MIEGFRRRDVLIPESQHSTLPLLGLLEKHDPINWMVMPDPDSDSCKLCKKLNQKAVAIGSIILRRDFYFKHFLCQDSVGN